MALYARMALDAGARIIGGCCGTSAKHLRAMRQALEAHTPGPAPTLEEINALLGDVSNGARAQWGGEQSRAGGAAPAPTCRVAALRARGALAAMPAPIAQVRALANEQIPGFGHKPGQVPAR